MNRSASKCVTFQSAKECSNSQVRMRRNNKQINNTLGVFTTRRGHGSVRIHCGKFDCGKPIMACLGGTIFPASTNTLQLQFPAIPNRKTWGCASVNWWWYALMTAAHTWGMMGIGRDSSEPVPCSHCSSPWGNCSSPSGAARTQLMWLNFLLTMVKSHSGVDNVRSRAPECRRCQTTSVSLLADSD